MTIFSNISVTSVSNEAVNPFVEKFGSDKDLVASILNGNQQAFVNVIRGTENLVGQIVCKMIPDAEERKDVVQDIYMKAFHHLNSFQFKAKLSTWIAQIAYNTCLHYLRKKKPSLLQDPQQWEAQEEQAATTSGPDVLLNQKELNATLAEAIDQLPPVYKTIITLYHHQELSYEEIATIMELPQGTLKSYLFRARKTLKDKLLHRYQNNEL